MLACFCSFICLYLLFDQQTQADMPFTHVLGKVVLLTVGICAAEVFRREFLLQ